MNPRRLALPRPRSLPPLFPWLRLLTVFCLLAASGTPVPALARSEWDGPIVAAPDAYTQNDFRRAYAVWERRILVDGFHAHGRVGKPWDDEAEAFVDAAHTFLVEEVKDEAAAAARVPRRKDLADHGRKLVEGGCDDPVVLYLAGKLAHQQANNWRAALGDYEQAGKRFQERPDYPAAAAVILGKALRFCYDRANAPAKGKAADAITLAALRRSIADSSYTQGEDYIFLQDLLGEDQEWWFKLNDEAIAAWLPETTLPEWARKTILGYVEVNRAWHVRGGGWARDVEHDAWKGFGEHMALAREALVAAWSCARTRPEARA